MSELVDEGAGNREQRKEFRGRGREGVEWWAGNLRTSAAEIEEIGGDAEDMRSQLSLKMAVWQANLEYSGMRDHLTGILSKRSIEVRLKEAIELMRAHGNAGVGVAFLDLDKFSEIAKPPAGQRQTLENEEAGDEIIKKYARFITNTCRLQFQQTREAEWQQAQIGRIGGEELLMVFPGVTFDDLSEITEHLRREMEEKFADTAGIATESRPRQTVSIGAVYMDAADKPVSPAGLVHRADALLKRAKEQGRNRVEIEKFPALPEEDESEEIPDERPDLEWRGIMAERQSRVLQLSQQYAKQITTFADAEGAVKLDLSNVHEWAERMNILDTELSIDKLTNTMYRGRDWLKSRCFWIWNWQGRTIP